MEAEAVVQLTDDPSGIEHIMTGGTCDCFCDVTLVVESRQIHYNKGVLALASPVWRKMFTSEFQEKKLVEIPLPGKTYHQVEALLRCLDPGEQKTVTDEDVDVILPLVEEYQMANLKGKCEQVLMERIRTMTSLTELLNFMTLVDTFHLPTAVTVASKALATFGVQDLQDAVKETKLDGATQVEIFREKARSLELKEEDNEQMKSVFDSSTLAEVIQKAAECHLLQFSHSLQKTAKYAAKFPVVDMDNFPKMTNTLDITDRMQFYRHRALYLEGENKQLTMQLQAIKLKSGNIQREAEVHRKDKTLMHHVLNDMREAAWSTYSHAVDGRCSDHRSFYTGTLDGSCKECTNAFLKYVKDRLSYVLNKNFAMVDNSGISWPYPCIKGSDQRS